MSELNYQTLSLDELVPFNNHPFKLYDDKRKEDMTESVKVNGIITPIIVRPTDDGKHEILSGHNRAEAAKEAGLTEIPAIVRTDLSDDEALLIVTETNLIQRSFADMSHSERATVIAAHHEATKHQGKRRELVSEVEELLGTSRLIGEKVKDRKAAGTKYDISARMQSRYLRVNELVPELKERLDRGEMPLYAAVSLSFLRKREQESLDALLDKFEINMRTAEILREMSAEKQLNKDEIKKVLAGDDKPTKMKPIKFSGKFLSQYFNEEQDPKEIEDIVAQALQKWFNEQNS
jgi:ParB family chromosome partitioning protein